MRDSPRTKHELSAKLGYISPAFPHRHADSQGISDDHRDTPDQPVSHVLAFLRIRTRVSSAVGHSECVVYAEARIGVYGERGVEDVCILHILTVSFL